MEEDRITRLERLLSERSQREACFSSRAAQEKKSSRLTLKKLKIRDGGKTIEVRTGLTEEEFVYVLSLLEKHPEGLKRGRKLLDLDIRLVILLEWLRHGETKNWLSPSKSQIVKSRPRLHPCGMVFHKPFSKI